MSLAPTGLDVSPNQGYYRIAVEYDTHGFDMFTDDDDEAVQTRAAFRADGANADITAYDETTGGYNLNWRDEL